MENEFNFPCFTAVECYSKKIILSIFFKKYTFVVCVSKTCNIKNVLSE